MKPANLKRTCVIHYVTEEGMPATWQVACTEADDEKSMRAHAARWFPYMPITKIVFDDGPKEKTS